MIFQYYNLVYENVFLLHITLLQKEQFINYQSISKDYNTFFNIKIIKASLILIFVVW